MGPPTRCLLSWGAIAAVVLAGTGAVATARAQESDNPYTSRIDVRMGRGLFEAQCASCHGLNATGGPEVVGPDLTTGEFRRASTDTGLFAVIRDGVNGTSMVGLGADAPDQSVWQLVTYLRSLDPMVAVAAVDGSATAGQQLFTEVGECVRCHMVGGQGRRLGPDLSDVGSRRTADELRADLTDPDAEVDPRWWTVTVTREDGTVVDGLRMSEDTFSLRLMDADENLHAFSKLEVASYDRRMTSTMPATTLTDTEIDDLIAYLVSLRRER